MTVPEIEVVEISEDKNTENADVVVEEVKINEDDNFQNKQEVEEIQEEGTL